MDLQPCKYDTDKGEGYLRVYERFFYPLKNAKVNLLEVGVYKGGSLLLWRDYFPNGNIVGIDINPVEIYTTPHPCCQQS